MEKCTSFSLLKAWISKLILLLELLYNTPIELLYNCIK